MKKAIFLILVFAMCFGLCACGATSDSHTSVDISKQDSYADIKGKLIGVWYGETDASFFSDEYDSEEFYTHMWVEFKSDGSVEVNKNLDYKPVGTVSSEILKGIYTIQAGEIILKYSQSGTIRADHSYVLEDCVGSDSLQYTFQNGNLSLYISGNELTKE